jgi:xylan 1,4-beta-xylosidase
VDSDSALATTTEGGALVAALWNYAPPVGTGAAYTPEPAKAGPDKTMEIKFVGVGENAAVTLYRVDGTHGNVIRAFDAMGRLATPTREQIIELRKAGGASPPEHAKLLHGTLTVTIPAHGLMLVKFEQGRK